MGIYYNHELARARFKSEFWFDMWYNSDGQFKGSDIKPKNKYFYQPKITSSYSLTDNLAISYYQDDRTRIKLLQASQGYHLLDSPYKIIWATARTTKFYYSCDKIILWGQDFGGIGSKNNDDLGSITSKTIRELTITASIAIIDIYL